MLLTPNLVHDVNIVGKPVEKCVGDQLGKEEAEKLVKQELKVVVASYLPD